MKSETPWLLLSEIVEDIIDRRGVTPIKLGGDFCATGHRVISAKIIKNGQIDLEADEARYVDDLIYKKWMKNPLQKDDVLMTSEAPLGELAYLNSDKDWVLGQRLFAIRPKKEVMSGRFLYYVLQTQNVRSDILGRASGTTVQGIRQAELRLVKIPVPPMSQQLAVSNLLGNIDDRITLLRETNKSLKAIARAIYKSWFIDFDPVRAKSEGRLPDGIDADTAALFPSTFNETELGQVPQGWTNVSLKEVISIHDSKRKPLSGQQRANRKGMYPYYGAAALMDYVDDYLFDGVYLLTGEDGSVADAEGYPIMQYVWGKFWVNNHAHILQGKDGVSTEHILLALEKTNISPFITGAVQAKLSQTNMWRINFLKPSKEVSECFGKVVDPLYSRLRHNTEQAQTLASLRDALLPRLISGQLSINAAQREVQLA